jgi:hypothetical protein
LSSINPTTVRIKSPKTKVTDGKSIFIREALAAKKNPKKVVE